MKISVIENDLKVQLGTVPFPYWIVDGMPTPSCLEIASGGVFPSPWDGYDNCDERKQTCRDRKWFPNELNVLFDLLLGDLFVKDIQDLLGIYISGLRADETLHGGGLHVMKGGDFLGRHLDYALHPKTHVLMERRLNYVQFLVPQWSERWGGAFEMWNDDATECVQRVYPAPGRAVLWQPSDPKDVNFHATQRIAEDCPISRMTANVFYLAPARAGVCRKRALFVPQRN